WGEWHPSGCSRPPPPDPLPPPPGGGGGGALAASALRNSPSWISTRRSASAAMERSCVTIRIVFPCRCSSLKSSSTSCPVLESSAPVGSSARSIAGRLASARDRDALRLPARQLRRQHACLFRDPDLLQQLQRPLPPLLARNARVEHRQ